MSVKWWAIPHVQAPPPACEARLELHDDRGGILYAITCQRGPHDVEDLAHYRHVRTADPYSQFEVVWK